MADAAVLKMPRGMADKTGVDPANSGTAAATSKARAYIEGPPTDGGQNNIGRWILQLTGTQADSNSMTAATYRHIGDFPNGGTNVAAPTQFNYVGLGS